MFGQFPACFLPLLPQPPQISLYRHIIPLTNAKMSSTVTVTEGPAITADNVLRLFPEVSTALIGGTHHSATQDNDMDGYDEEQIKLMDEVCIVLDNNDIPIGSASKKVCKSLQKPVHEVCGIRCAS
jgi:hypothetical protein